MKKLYSFIEKCWRLTNRLVPRRYFLLPPVVVIGITFRCNYNCSMCCVTPSLNSKEMSFNNYKHLIRQLKKAYRFLPYKPIIWLMGGEPTIHRDFERILKYTAKAGFKYGFTSNGLNLKEKYMKIISKHNIAQVRISLDGNEEEHNRARGNKKAYAGAVNALKLLKKYKIDCRINSIISPRHKSFAHIMDLSKKMDVSAYFDHMVFLDKKRSKKFEKQLDIIKEALVDGSVYVNYENGFSEKSIKDLWDEMKTINPNQKNIVIDPIFKSYKSLKNYYMSSGSIINTKELTFLNYAQISPSMNLYGQSKTLDQHSFSKLWNSKEIRTFRNKMFSFKYLPRVAPLSWR